ncbi:MAG: C25 family cysteine peptidase [Candidatus Thermoplasmatota archaeon]|nr:C25 family cysteine peptidase [Candidatus Thermoplasmatota archaeon]
MTLTDTQGQIVAYANSMGYDIGKTKLETLTCNASGEYTLIVTVYNGIKGGFFIQRGISRVDADITVTATITTLTRPHLPLIPKLSMMASYLTAAHGGLLIANTTWELIDDSYVHAAAGSGTGPWYNESLHIFTNEKVNKTVSLINRTVQLLETHQLRSGYLHGPAWLAILADTTMIPMFYYGPSQEDIPDRGLPSDNPYSLNESLSVGRLISWDVEDVSVLIARTFFYEKLCGQPATPIDWHHQFSFIFGEGFSETGGIFHQIPYSKEIKKYGFVPTVYGDLRNSRQITTCLNVYTGANYIEYLGHGDWFWFPASLYGYDIYSKAVDVAHAKDWVYEKPSNFLASACLMGRTDGLLPQMNIGLTMLHAGCNGFVGATRETGQESGLTILENHLIVDDWSLGEALRGEKRIDQELPTYYVRTLYGDPAFNPYEPLNGFHDQGRPKLKP